MTADFNAHDRDYLQQAGRLARRGWGLAHPNPMVGCVLVRDGAVVGEGWHRRFGGPHAEVEALESAQDDARGATAYVTLEPCDHHGKTPPCSRALLAAEVRRVVFGAADPGGASGGGADTLRDGGVDVVGPVWSEQRARAENPAFFHLCRHASPYVALKLALSLDGAIASAPGVRTQITGSDALRKTHLLRTGFDAVLVGGGTARADDPRLTVRMVEQRGRSARRIVLDSAARVPTDAALFRDVASDPLSVFVADEAPEVNVERLHAAGASVHRVPTSPQGLDLDAVLEASWDLGVRSILCEGGARIASGLLTHDHVQRMYLFLAPTTLGAGALEAFPGVPRDVWDRFHPGREPRSYGRDTLLTLDRRP